MRVLKSTLFFASSILLHFDGPSYLISKENAIFRNTHTHTHSSFLRVCPKWKKTTRQYKKKRICCPQISIPLPVQCGPTTEERECVVMMERKTSVAEVWRPSGQPQQSLHGRHAKTRQMMMMMPLMMVMMMRRADFNLTRSWYAGARVG